MKENKLFKALSSLSRDEFLRFGNFLNSPYFNKSKSNIKLYNFLKELYPEFDSPQLNKKNVFKLIYPEETYSDRKLRDRFTHFLSMVKVFLAIEKYNESNFDFRRNLIAALNEKGLYAIVEEEFESAMNEIENMKYKDEDYYLNKYLLEVAKREINDWKIPIGQKDELYSDVKNEIDDAIHFFLIIMLKEYSNVANVERHVKIDHRFKFFEQIITYLSQEEELYKDNILIKVLYNFFQLYRGSYDKHFVYYIRDLLINNKESMERDIFQMLFIELYNQCKRKQSCGEKEFGKISFELMNQMLKEEVFFREDGTISAHTYINLAASGLRENELTWADHFINEYKEKVPVKERENAFNYNYAVLFYMKGYGKDPVSKEQNYDTALSYLSKVKSDDFYYMTRIKNHSLKIYYELNQLEPALSLIDSYFHYLYRNPMIPQRLAERYHNFITFLQRLIRLKMKPDTHALQKLKTDLINNLNIEYKGWLTEMIDEFILKVKSL